MNKRIIGAIAGLCLLTAAPLTQAASLQGVSGFSNPGALTMQKYIPDGMAPQAPLVVVLHGCQQNGNEYFQDTGWKKLADQHKFALLVPTQTSSNNQNSCFNWFQPEDFQRGKGEAASIVNAMDKVIADHGLDNKRTFVTGVSAGGAMTLALLAAYPDRFKGGASHAGVHFGCANSVWAGLSCMNSTGSATADQVKSAYPGYNGPWPQVVVFHGTADQYVTFSHLGKNVSQWTAVHGIDAVADYSATIGNSDVKYYNDANGTTKVASVAIQGMKHAVGIHPGSADEDCGIAATEYYSNQNVCTSFVAGKLWGIIASNDDGFAGAGSGGGTTTTSGTTTTTHGTGTTTTTSSTPTTTTGGACFTANNVTHVANLRAYVMWGITYAVGSNQRMGLYNVLTTTKLRKTGTNYYTIDSSCP